RRRGDDAVAERGAVQVPDPVERRDHVGRELAGFVEHGGEGLVVEVVDAVGARGGKARRVTQREGDVGHGGAASHAAGPPGWTLRMLLLSQLALFWNFAGGRAAGERQDATAGTGLSPCILRPPLKLLAFRRMALFCQDRRAEPDPHPQEWRGAARRSGLAVN